MTVHDCRSFRSLSSGEDIQFDASLASVYSATEQQEDENAYDGRIRHEEIYCLDDAPDMVKSTHRLGKEPAPCGDNEKRDINGARFCSAAPPMKIASGGGGGESEFDVSILAGSRWRPHDAKTNQTNRRTGDLNPGDMKKGPTLNIPPEDCQQSKIYGSKSIIGWILRKEAPRGSTSVASLIGSRNGSIKILCDTASKDSIYNTIIGCSTLTAFTLVAIVLMLWNYIGTNDHSFPELFRCGKAKMFNHVIELSMERAQLQSLALANQEANEWKMRFEEGHEENSELKSQVKMMELWTNCTTDEVAKYFGYENRDAHGAGWCRDQGYEGASPQAEPYGQRRCVDGRPWYQFRCANTSLDENDGLWTPCYRNEDAKALGNFDRDDAGTAWCAGRGRELGFSKYRDCGNAYYQFKCH